MRRRRVALALAACLLLAGPAGAEERTVEVLGVNGFTPPRNLTAQRQTAVTEALRAAVYRVVADLLPALDDEAAGSAAHQYFSRDARDYVTRFRVVEDRGVQPKEFSSNRDATHEYVVRVEASVDAGQVRRRLVEVGLLASSGASAGWIELTLEGLPSYAAVERIRDALLDQLRADSAVPVEFTTRRVVLAVRMRGDGRSLLDQLSRADLGGFRLEPRAADGDRARAAVAAP